MLLEGATAGRCGPDLETPLAKTVDRSCGNTSGYFVDIFIKPRASKMFGNPEYYLDGPAPFITISGPHENFLKVVL